MGGNQNFPMEGGIPKSRSKIIQHRPPEPNKVNTMTPQNLLIHTEKRLYRSSPGFHRTRMEKQLHDNQNRQTTTDSDSNGARNQQSKA